MYRAKSQNHVHDCGLIVNPLFPCLGASPDGKVCDNGETGLLEVKCPFSARNMTIKEAVSPNSGLRNFFLTCDGDNFSLKKSHPYWYQVQGQLLVSGAKFCDFVKYTRQDYQAFRIYPDVETMEELLSKLCPIYCKIFCK